MQYSTVTIVALVDIQTLLIYWTIVQIGNNLVLVVKQWASPNIIYAMNKPVILVLIAQGSGGKGVEIRQQHTHKNWKKHTLWIGIQT